MCRKNLANFSQTAMWLLLFSSVGLLSISARAHSTFDDDHHVSYNGYKLLEIQTDSANDLQVLRSLENSVDFWSSPRLIGQSAIVSVSPSVAKDFTKILSKENIIYTILVDDLESTLAKERHQQRISSRKIHSSRSISFESYPRSNQINLYLDQLAQDYPNLVTVVNQAVTDEYRQIKYVKISNSTGGPKNRTIFIDAGIHAREWIAPSTALFVINQLVENSGENQDLLNLFDWVVLPLANPDGYEYSHTRDRMWRKTRRSQSLLCNGVDGNRNFGFKWGLVGSSTNPCSEIYQGKTAFSEVESQAIRDVLESVKSTCKMYLSLHSYGQYLVYPWGYTSDLPDTWQDLDEVARAGSNAIRAANGTVYTVGSATNVFYAASGASDDYAFAVKKIPISITMELPGGGFLGFDLPVDRIRATVEETWIGIRAMALKVNQKY